MTYQRFVFEDYSFDHTSSTASFHYSFDGQQNFTERVTFEVSSDYNAGVLDRALRLAFFVAGTSYYKCFPTCEVTFARHALSEKDSAFLSAVYHDGLSQFMFENNLNLDDMATFVAGDKHDKPVEYQGNGILALQSGGKDSLLLGQLLREKTIDFSTMYMSSTGDYPRVLDDVTGRPPRIVRRMVDRDALQLAKTHSALNGHVPVTYITLCYALIDAILHRENTILAAIGREGNEAHEWIGQLAVNHQWSKTWEAEQLLVEYVQDTISPQLHVGSPLRGLSELRIAELFVEKAWAQYGHRFSSCNLANYQQGHNNDQLTWCGECPKCANSFLLFAPFVDPRELADLFGGQNLFAKATLTDTFKGLLGIEGVMKPFECVGEVDELCAAYHMARERYGTETYSLPFDVPASNFDYLALGPVQNQMKII